METNVLYYGDNLDVLRRHVRQESVDLSYLEPPFKSNADYNVLFEEHGEKSTPRTWWAATPTASPTCSCAIDCTEDRVAAVARYVGRVVEVVGR